MAKMKMPMPTVAMEYEPEPRKTPGQLEREGMWYDAQMERLRLKGDHEAEYFYPNEDRRPSKFPGVLESVRSKDTGVRSMAQQMSEGCALNTGRPHRGPRGGVKLGTDSSD